MSSPAMRLVLGAAITYPVRVDARLPIVQFAKACAEAGISIVNDHSGGLVLTALPQDFLAAPTNTPVPSIAGDQHG